MWWHDIPGGGMRDDNQSPSFVTRPPSQRFGHVRQTQHGKHARFEREQRQKGESRKAAAVRGNA